MRINGYLDVIVSDDGDPMVRCRKCDAILGSARRSYKDYAAAARKPLPVASTAHALGAARSGDFELREYYCPSCFVLLDTEVARKQDPVLHDVELDAGQFDRN